MGMAWPGSALRTWHMVAHTHPHGHPHGYTYVEWQTHLRLEKSLLSTAQHRLSRDKRNHASVRISGVTRIVGSLQPLLLVPRGHAFVTITRTGQLLVPMRAMIIMMVP